MRIFVSIIYYIRPTLTYGCDAWTITTIMERRLRKFKTMYGEKYTVLCLIRIREVGEEDTKIL